MKLNSKLVLLCALVVFATLGIAQAAQAATTYVHFVIMDEAGDIIVGAPVIINGGSVQYTDSAGNATTIAWGCDGCAWTYDTCSVQVYNRTYYVDTSSVEIYSGIHADRHYNFPVTHIPSSRDPKYNVHEDPTGD